MVNKSTVNKGECHIMFHDNILMSSSDRVLILGCEADLLSDTETFSSC